MTEKSNGFNRNNGLDILRVIAVIFVSFAHFTFTAHHRTNISGINNSEVIVKDNDWLLLIPDEFLSSNFGTYLGTLGVSIFFVTTGYLMPLMMERYTRKEFLINRIFRIYPTLIVSVLLTWIFVFLCGKSNFDFNNILHSIFLTFQFWKVEAVIPVLWTLVIEMCFYFLCFGVGVFTPVKLFFTIFCIALFSIMANFWHFGVLEYIIKYILIILVGSALYFLHTNREEKYKNIFILIVASISWFLVFTYTEPNSPYSRLETIILVEIIILFFLFYSFKPLKFIILLSNIVYPMYLLHFTLGLTTMIWVKTFLSDNSYIMILSAYSMVFTISLIIHYQVEKPFYFYIKHKLKKGLNS